MKACILLLSLLLYHAVVSAQEYSECNYTYFAKSKIVSTSLCYDKDGRWGKASAFNRIGKEIYGRELRHVAGHSSVEFSYYATGAVKTARWSSAPDAGIQWYKSYMTFSEDGKITGETKDSYDERGPGLEPLQRPGQRPNVQPVPVTTPAPSQTMECAVIYSSEFWFTNYTPYTVIITATRKFSRSDTYTLSLRPKETLKAGQMILAQQFDEPAKFFDFSVMPYKPGNKQKFIIIPAERASEDVKKEVRRYHYEVRRII